MPILSYKCPEGHEQDILCRYDARPESVPCDDIVCMAMDVVARQAPTAPYTPGIGHHPGVKTHAREVGGTNGIREGEFECNACHKHYYEPLAPADPTPPCPACSSCDVREVVGFPHTTSIRFPYWCLGLGCEVRSPQHRLDLARERGLIPWEDTSASVIDQIERAESQQATETAAAAARGDAYYRELEEHPKYADYRKARDKGVFDDQIREALDELDDGTDIDLAGADDATREKVEAMRAAEAAAPIVIKSASPTP